MPKKYFYIVSIITVTIMTVLLITAYLTSYANVQISTSPEDALVVIDGSIQSRYEDGSTYITTKIKRGQHVITISAPGFKPLETSFETKLFGNTILEYSLERQLPIIEGLPTEDKDNNYHIYGYYGVDYRPTYKIELFNPDAKSKAMYFLNKQGVTEENSTLIFSEEYDLTGEAAPN